MKTVFRGILFLAALLFIVADQHAAIASEVLVFGTVQDEQGIRIPDASISIKSLSTGAEYQSATDQGGNYSVTVSIGPTFVENPATRGFQLYQNYPNPFNPSTVIAFDLAESGRTSLSVYNMLGQNVIVLADGYFPSGCHQVTWDGRDSCGMNAAAGIYFARIQNGQYTRTIKMLLLDGAPGNRVSKPAALSNYLQEAESDTLFQITVTKPGYILDGDRIVIAPAETAINRNFSLLESSVECALMYSKETGLGNWKHIVNALDGHIVYQYLSSNEVRQAAFSPNGDYIVYPYGGTNTLVRMNVKTNESIELVVNPFHISNMVEWTPDGSLIIFKKSVGGDSQIPYTIYPDGTNLKEAPAFFGKQKFYLADSYHFLFLDGTRLFRSNLSGTEPEMVLDIDTLFPDPFTVNYYAAFNPVTNLFFISVSVNAAWKMYCIDISTGEKSLVYSGPGTHFCVDPKTNRLAFSDENDQIIVLDLFNNSTIGRYTISAEEWDYIYDLSFSPGGRYLAFAASKPFECGYLGLVDTESGHIMKIDQPCIYNIAWNPAFPY